MTCIPFLGSFRNAFPHIGDFRTRFLEKNRWLTFFRILSKLSVSVSKAKQVIIIVFSSK